MKKLLAVLAFASISLSGFAQEAAPVEKYSVATNSFWSNWFVQGGVNWNAWYQSAEHGMGHGKNPFKSFRSNPGIALAVGKWFTPGIGLRTKVQGVWGKRPSDGTSNKYWVVNEHVMFNVTNMLMGYNESRIWDIVPFAGVGIGRSMTHNNYAWDASAGIQIPVKVAKKLSVYVEGGWNCFSPGIDGCAGNPGGHRGWDKRDNNLYAEVGVSYNLGKGTWKKVPDVDAINALHQSELDALNAKLNDANAENDRLKNLLENQKPATAPAAAKEYVTTPVSVFFNLGKSTVASKKDLVNVEALAKYAKDNNAKLLVNGYADNATGTPAYNQKLSQSRADVVAKELVKMGVDKANITTKANGGVKDLSPISYNRRATVEIAK